MQQQAAHIQAGFHHLLLACIIKLNGIQIVLYRQEKLYNKQTYKRWKKIGKKIAPTCQNCSTIAIAVGFEYP